MLGAQWLEDSVSCLGTSDAFSSRYVSSPASTYWLSKYQYLFVAFILYTSATSQDMTRHAFTMAELAPLPPHAGRLIIGTDMGRGD